MTPADCEQLRQIAQMFSCLSDEEQARFLAECAAMDGFRRTAESARG